MVRLARCIPWLAAFCTITITSATDRQSEFPLVYFPKSIPVYAHRRDVNTGELVSRGRLIQLNGLSPLPDGERVSLQELRTILQCSPDEPDLVGDRGSVLLATRMVPPTRETIRLMATWVESRCDVWAKCNEELKRFDSGETREWGVGGKKGAMDSPFQVRLLRVLQGKLYIDWPFNHKQRFGKLAETESPNSDY